MGGKGSGKPRAVIDPKVTPKVTGRLLSLWIGCSRDSAKRKFDAIERIAPEVVHYGISGPGGAKKARWIHAAEIVRFIPELKHNPVDLGLKRLAAKVSELERRLDEHLESHE